MSDTRRRSHCTATFFLTMLASSIGLASACKSEVPPPREQVVPEPDTATESPSATPEPPAAAEPTPTCAAGGRPWDGQHRDCLYEVARCCYDTPETACAAANCPAADCHILESFPAQIACRGGGDPEAPTADM